MFKVGDRVSHKKFGRGTIKYVVEERHDVAPYFVEFDNKHELLHSGGWRGYHGEIGRCFWLRDNSLSRAVTFKGNKHATAS